MTINISLPKSINDFTPEVEEEILRRSMEPVDNDVVWDGKTPFVKFALNGKY